MGPAGVNGGLEARGLRVDRVADGVALAWSAAEHLARLSAGAVAARGRFTLALSGGATPRALYRLLADPGAPFRAAVPWPSVDAYFGDERAVPPDHEASNAGMARAALLDHVPLGSVHRIAGELGAAEAAARYDAELRGVFGASAAPALDLILLGLGTDGHTASLFPGSPALLERARWAVAAPGPRPFAERVTLTPPVLEAARTVLFLVSGADKAEPLRRLVRPRTGEEPVPASTLRFGGQVFVLADAAAAAAID